MITVNAEIKNVSPNEARDLVLDLKKNVTRELSRQDQETKTEINRADDSALDLGTILTIILAGPAVVALANAVRDWVKFNSGVDLELNGVNVKNANSEDIAEIIKAIQDQNDG